MRDVVIVDALRTPIGRFRGALAGVRADHLGAAVLDALVTRNGLDPQLVGDVIFGNVTQVGEQSANVARTALLSAGWSAGVPGLTIDRKCGSSEAAVHVAAGQIGSGLREIVVAGGVESMSRVPMGGNRDVHGDAFGSLLLSRFEMTSQGEASERIADQWGIERDDMDDYAIESHRRAVVAAEEGRFDGEILPLDTARWSGTGKKGMMLAADETIRRNSTREMLATLETRFRKNGRSTAGNSSQISDGAAGLLLMARETAEAMGFAPRALVRAGTTVGSDPTLMLTGPVEATRRILDMAGLNLGDIDLFEVNEAFASVPIMWMREFGLDAERLNVNGGAIALGHPLGASGARIMTTLLHEMERRGARYGLQTMCCAGGLGTATILERID